jgi:hypothetical protein
LAVDSDRPTRIETAAEQVGDENLADDPQALRFGDPTPDVPGRAGREALDEPTFANFGPDVANQLLVMAAIVASSALIALRKRSGLLLGRNRQVRSRTR